MGGGRFDPGAYRAFADKTVGKSTDEIYASRSIKNNLNPFGVKMRESRDSADNPKSTPLIMALDVTGSMGMIADAIARQGLGTLFTSILEHKPISDPHVMFMGIGDATYDRSPLQVSQFEADNRIVDQLTDLYIERGGGGNQFESYNLAWYFAANHTVHDSMVKRGTRGYLFTVGDECAPEDLTVDQIKRIIGPTQHVPSTKVLLKQAQESYDVFHIVIKEGDYASRRLEHVRDTWRPLIGQSLIELDDHTKLAETVVSIIQLREGETSEKAAGLWDGSTMRTVHDAIKHLPAGTNRRLLGA